MELLHRALHWLGDSGQEYRHLLSGDCAYNHPCRLCGMIQLPKPCIITVLHPAGCSVWTAKQVAVYPVRCAVIVNPTVTITVGIAPYVVISRDIRRLVLRSRRNILRDAIR